MGAILSGLFW